MSKKAARVYFLLSAGWGPVTRALPVANALKAQGAKTFFHVSGSVAEAMTKSGHEFVAPVSFPQTGKPQRYWWTLDQLLADFGWADREFVERRFRAYRDAILSVRPDVLVVDFNTSAMLVARALKIPTVAIVQSCFHPARTRPYIVWWKNPPTELPTVTPILNEILTQHNATPVTRAEELQVGDITVIPSFQEFDPLSVTDENTHYVGPIVGGDIGLPSSRVEKSAEKVIVVYPGRPRDMGGESGALIMRTVVPVLERLGIPAIISHGAFDYPDFVAPRGRVTFVPWISMEEISSRCQLMIHHGGHGSCLNAVVNGMPSLVIPTFAEREYNARNLEALGCAISLPPEVLSEDSIEQSLGLLRTPKYSEQARFWKEELIRRHYEGATEIVRLVLSLIR